MKLLFSLLLSLSSCSVTAQNPANDSWKQQLIADWERAKAYTGEYLTAMPADQYGFRAADSIRSFSQQMLHLAIANVVMATHATGVQNAGVQAVFFKPGFEQRPTAQSRDSVMYYVYTSYDYTINALKRMNGGQLGEVVTRDMPGGRRTATRLGWLLKAFEHQTHHRGQCTIYLRRLEIRPPAEKLW
ncbi:DinB family protein [Spirosoma endbachense]|uniref:Damage-inducible protein DinB n=1 Tax=Spirosoma endbachense TaxID=2666025 RepID=A0A6P1WAU6_9BACT|nr:DinB family protein [Spirosoma endbachense]QHW01011.1 damage-inducible protein DinB [Spirosoma endbachense]